MASHSALKLITTALLLSACSSNPVPSGGSASNQIADLQVVDCLLPGQVRRIGNTSYMTPRRPVQATAADCRIRGGEYTAYDRADYKTALNIWLETAEKGDAEAQVNVGEIFERGLGAEPNYEAAHIWYAKAAKQGNSRAQFNLGTLYEQGLGVDANKLEALNWYRKAWGLEEDNILYQSTARKEQEALRKQLLKESSKKDRQVQLLDKQLKELESTSASAEKMAELNDEISELRVWIAKLKEEKLEAKRKADAIPKFREPEAISVAAAGGKAVIDEPKDRTQGKLEFGKYYALIIGNEHYSDLDDLQTPIKDSQRLAKVLEDKYGFSVKLLTDVDNLGIMQAVNDLNSVLTDKDNLLIFYAGHGSRVKTKTLESGYWLPTNANQPPNDTNWVSSEFITRHLSRIQAKRVLVVADSCYSGLLSQAPGYVFFGENQQSEDYIRYKMAKRSRLLMSSGGDKPVLDNAGQGHSVFARAFLETLDSNEKIISAPELFMSLRDQVKQSAAKVGVDQQPEFKAIKGAGHEVGDFFLVPNTAKKQAI